MSRRLPRFMLFGQPAGAFLMQRLARSAEFAAGLLEPLDLIAAPFFALRQLTPLLFELGSLAQELLLERGQPFLHLLTFVLDLRSAFLNVGNEFIVLFGLFGQASLPRSQFLSAAP